MLNYWPNIFIGKCGVLQWITYLLLSVSLRNSYSREPSPSIPPCLYLYILWAASSFVASLPQPLLNVMALVVLFVNKDHSTSFHKIKKKKILICKEKESHIFQFTSLNSIKAYNSVSFWKVVLPCAFFLSTVLKQSRKKKHSPTVFRQNLPFPPGFQMILKRKARLWKYYLHAH